MPEQDALGTFNFDQFSKPGKFVKFKAGQPIVLRILTTDPVVKDEIYNQGTDEESLSTRFYFIVYNFTDERAQILNATPAMARKISELHVDEDFGANIRKIDIKFSPTGEKLERRYDIQVLPKANELSAAQIKEAQEIDLDKEIEGGGRMSIYEPPKVQEDIAKEVTEKTNNEPNPKDVVIEDIGQPISLDDIPF